MTLLELSNVFYRYWGKGLPTWIVLESYRLIKPWFLILPRRQKGKNEINERGFEKLKYALFCCDYTQVCRLTRLSPFVPNLSQIIPFSKSEVNLTNWIEHISLKWSKYLPLDFGRNTLFMQRTLGELLQSVAVLFRYTGRSFWNVDAGSGTGLEMLPFGGPHFE